MIWSIWPLLAAFGLIAVWARSTASPPVPSTAEAPRRWRFGALEVLIALASAVTYGVLAGLDLPRYHLGGGDYGEVDFAGYCRSLGALRDGVGADWGAKHSLFAGLALLPLTRAIGVLGALTAGALVSGGAFGLGVYLWARIAGGRVAGVCAVLFAAANQNLVWLSRSPSFYPETTAASVLGVAGVAAALRWRTLPALFAGGCGVGVILASDVRYLTVGLWCWALLLLATFWGRPPALPGRLLVSLAPIVISWWLAHLAQGSVVGMPEPAGAVRQAIGFLGDVAGYPGQEDPNVLERTDFVWGVHPVWRLPTTLTELRHLSSMLPPGAGDDATLAAARATYLAPWVIPLSAAFLASIPMLRDRRWSWLAATAPTAPFLLNLYVVLHTLARPVGYPLGMTPFPVLLGVGVAACGGARWPRLPAAVLVVGLLLVVVGVIPSFFSPIAAWRVPDMTHNRVYDALARATGGTPAPGLIHEWPSGQDAVQCVRVIEADAARGLTWMPFPDTPRPMIRQPFGLAPSPASPPPALRAPE